MENSSQLVLRNGGRLQAPLLVVGPPDDDFTDRCPVGGVGLTDHWGLAARLGGPRNFNILFGCDPDVLEDRRFMQALVFMPKSRQELAMRLALAASRLETDAEILVVGAKREGIAGAGKPLAVLCKSVQKCDAARHCQLWSGILAGSPRPFRLADWFETFEEEVGGLRLRVKALPGVFSAGRIDAGTRMLLETFQSDSTLVGPVLDFASGAGIIGTWLASRFSIEVELVDVQAQAVVSSAATLAANGVQGQVRAVDGLSAQDRRYGMIVTNPPFHQGVQMDTRVTERFLREAARHLKPDGELRLVGNAFLPYRALIESAIGPVSVLAEDSRFRVYSARRDIRTHSTRR